jgi:hypothetical protein
MIPQFSSAELNQLLNLELSEGMYQRPEDALIAGLKLLRESREFQAQLAERIASLHDGRAIELAEDQQLGEFLDEIDREVDAELASGSHPNV